jgi:hypothetical protein
MRTVWRRLQLRRERCPGVCVHVLIRVRLDSDELKRMCRYQCDVHDGRLRAG